MDNFKEKEPVSQTITAPCVPRMPIQSALQIASHTKTNVFSIAETELEDGILQSKKHVVPAGNSACLNFNLIISD